jgi:hypothetical protein
MPQNQALGYSNDHVRIRIITLRKARITFEHSGHVVASLDRKCLGQKSVRESGTWLRGISDKETRRKPLAVAADALSYGD